MSTAISVQGGGIECLVDGVEVEDDIEFTTNRYKWMKVAYASNTADAIVYHGNIYQMGGSGSTYSTYCYKYMGGAWAKDSTDLPIQFSSGKSVIQGDMIHILGSNMGSNYNTKHYRRYYNNNASTLNQKDEWSWESVSTLPYAFNRGSAVTFNEEIHIFGGQSYGTNHYKWNGSSWTSVSTLPFSLGERYCACVFNNQLNILYVSYHYKWNGTTWTSVSTIPMSYNCGVLILFNNGIVLMGGHTSCYKKVIKWDGTEWSELDYAPYNVYYSLAVTWNGNIHLMSGQSPYSDCHYHYNGVDREYTWRKVINPSFPYSVDGKDGLVTFNDEIHLFGNNSNNTNAHYKFAGDQWEALTDIPYNFGSNGAVLVLNNAVHLLGGNVNPTYHYKWDGITWTSVSILPATFNNTCGACIYSNEIHFFANYDHYKWNGTTWTSVSTMPRSFYNSTAIEYKGSIQFFGGFNSSQIHYAWDGETWTDMGTLPFKKEYGFAVIYKDRMWSLGNRFSGYTWYNYSWDGTQWIKEEDAPQQNLLVGVIWKGEIFTGSGNTAYVYGDLWHNSFVEYQKVAKKV